ncbi:cytochrome P450 family protein [Actinomycetota bacterium Odt1-20B]
MIRQQCPYALASTGRDPRADAELRARGPVAPVLLPGGVHGVAVTDIDLIRRLSIDPRISKDAYQHWPDWISGEVDGSWPLSIWVSVRNMLTAYGEKHTRLRKLVAGAFTARRTAAMQPAVARITDQLLDRLAALPQGQIVDVRRELALPLPTLVINELLGLPEERHADLQRVIGVSFRTSATPEEAQANQSELYEILQELIAAKRAAPGADLVSELITARDDGGVGMSEKELLDMLLLMVGAGIETTVNLIEQAIHALISHPGQLQLVRSGVASWEDVVDETLRCYGVFANMPFRFAIEEIEVDGATIPRGTPILLSFAAASRDPWRYGDDADEFDLTRSTLREHVAFGHGVHHCLGRPLARLEVTTALEALFARFPQIKLGVPQDELRMQESFISNGHSALPVLLGPEVVA